MGVLQEAYALQCKRVPAAVVRLSAPHGSQRAELAAAARLWRAAEQAAFVSSLARERRPTSRLGGPRRPRAANSRTTRASAWLLGADGAGLGGRHQSRQRRFSGAAGAAALAESARGARPPLGAACGGPRGARRGALCQAAMRCRSRGDAPNARMRRLLRQSLAAMLACRAPAASSPGRLHVLYCCDSVHAYTPRHCARGGRNRQQEGFHSSSNLCALSSAPATCPISLPSGDMALSSDLEPTTLRRYSLPTKGSDLSQLYGAVRTLLQSSSSLRRLPNVSYSRENQRRSGVDSRRVHSQCDAVFPLAKCQLSQGRVSAPPQRYKD